MHSALRDHLIALLAERWMTIPPGNTRIMATKPTEATEHGCLTSLITSTERWLRAAKRSPSTIRSYGDAAQMLEALL